MKSESEKENKNENENENEKENEKEKENENNNNITIGSIVQVVFDYTSESENEISAKKGDLLQVQEISDEWIFVEKIEVDAACRISGFIPLSFVVYFAPPNIGITKQNKTKQNKNKTKQNKTK